MKLFAVLHGRTINGEIRWEVTSIWSERAKAHLERRHNASTRDGGWLVQEVNLNSTILMPGVTQAVEAAIERG